MDEKFLSQRIVKAFRHIPTMELPDAPVYALKGLSEHDGELLYESFWVRTIRDLADLRFVHWAQEILALKDVPQEKIDMYGFQEKLNKAYEQTPIRTLIKSPVHVLQGLSEDDAIRLEEAFKVRTVKDLANLKFARFAQEICREAYGDLSSPISSTAARPRENQTKTERRYGRLIAMILTVIALLLLAYFAPICFPAGGPGTSANDTEITRDDNQPNTGDERHTDSTFPDGRETEVSPDARPDNTNTGDAPAEESSSGAGDNARDVNSSLQRGTYFVQDGDTLFEISKRLYGKPDRWKDIYERNRDRLKSPDDIFPGDELTLPR
ncbi:MAG: LysM peptidoglycan-binding domain-containing protein [Leptospiraceae bacterium]|nr:LysM peptidoglycan-binding domain-containing protein [Leptospiraceae bacterium]